VRTGDEGELDTPPPFIPGQVRKRSTSYNVRVLSSGTTYLDLDIATVTDREPWPPPEPPAGLERPFPPLYACKPVVIGVMWIGADLAVRRIGAFGAEKDADSKRSSFA